MHWAAYACWPVAVLHGLGTGTDARSAWLQAADRRVRGPRRRRARGAPAARLAGPAGLRLGALALVAASVVGAVVFTLQGPLKPGWARRAGTPATLLAAARSPVVTRTVSAPPTVALPFAAALDGTSRQIGSAGDGRAQVDIAAQIHVAGAPLSLDLQLYGQALPGGGLQMVSSSVGLGPGGRADLYRGRVTGLRGDLIVARLTSPGARPLQLRLALRMTPAVRWSGRPPPRGDVMSGASGLPRLLRGIEDGSTLTLAQHGRVHGPLDMSGRDAGARLLDAIEHSGLRGRGGAHVSSALKLRAVAERRRRAVVVANGSESQPQPQGRRAAHPHAAPRDRRRDRRRHRRRRREVVLYVKRSNPRVWAGVLRAVDERRAAGARGPTLRIVAAPDSYVSGQETAAIAHSTAGRRCRRRSRRGRSSAASTPSDLHQQRRDAGAHGAHRAPRRRLVSHARVADAARECARDLGRRRRPPRCLRDRLWQPAGRPAPSRRRSQRASAGAAGRRLRRRLARRAAHAGPDAERGRSAARRRLDRSRRPLGPRRGPCGVWESARVLDYLADQSARQCGPCLYGLRAIADSFDLLARGTARQASARG